ncbi:hypothetical protein [Streptomyces sp. NPDC001127]|uniref:hypothetical protein n=1 Tax=Streptomyces sp. NPDC001127 TaxID=3154377 RepID=UPI003316D434
MQADGDLAGDGQQVLIVRSMGRSVGRRLLSGGAVQQEADIQQVPDRFRLALLLAFEVDDFGRVQQYEIVEDVFAGTAPLPSRVEVAASGSDIGVGLDEAAEPSQKDRQDRVVGVTGGVAPPQFLQRAAVAVLDQAAGVDRGGHG